MKDDRLMHGDSPFLPGEIESGERLLWFGKPVAAPPITFGDFLLGLFGCAFMALPCLFLLAALGLVHIRDGGPAFTGLAPILCGLCASITLGRLATDRWRWQRVTYALTDRRIYRIVDGAKRVCRHFSLHSVDHTDVVVNPDGSGSVFFRMHTLTGSSGDWDNRVRSGDWNGVAFLNVAEVRRVEAFLDELKPCASESEA